MKPNKPITSYNLHYKRGQEYTIQGKILIYSKMVKGILMFKEKETGKRYGLDKDQVSLTEIK